MVISSAPASILSYLVTESSIFNRHAFKGAVSLVL
jgi:hypothetical protein